MDFENKIVLDLMAVKQKYPQRSIILEDESRNIGSRHLPIPLTEAMNKSPMVVIELSFDERIEKLFQEYVIKKLLPIKKKMPTVSSLITSLRVYCA